MKYALTLLALAFSAVIPASAQVEYVLVMPSTGISSAGCGITTDPLASVFQGSKIIPISSFTFNGTDAVNANGIPSGGANLLNFKISKNFDNCSASLAAAFLTNFPIPKVTIYARKAAVVGPNATKPSPFLSITLEDVLISQFTMTSSSELPTEQLGFAFKEIGVTAVNNTTKNVLFYSWNVVTNTLGTDLKIDPFVKFTDQ